MPPIQTLPPEVKQVLPRVDQYVDRMVGAKGPPVLSAAETDDLKRAVRTVTTTFGEVNRAGNYVNPVNRAVADAVTAKRDTIVQGVADATAKGRKPTPLDYYDIYYKVMADSGVVAQSLVDPGVLNRMVAAADGRWEGDLFLFRPPLVPAADCGYCGVCGACSICSICSLCGISGVVGTIGTGVVGATIGLASLFAS